MPCPICGIDIIIKDDEWTKCKHARNNIHMKNKFVYKLKKDSKNKQGFSKIIQAEVKNYAKYYGIKEMEEENEKTNNI